MNILKLAAAAVIVIGAAVPSAALAETLKVSTFVPPNHAFNVMLTAWGEELAEKSGGELTIDLFPAGQLGPPPRQYDLAVTGAADIAVALIALTPGRFPMAELAALPLSYPSAGSSSAVSSERLTSLADEYLAEETKGTKILWMAVTPPLKINMSGDPIDTLADLSGKRIRYAGSVFQSMVESLGATPMPVAPGEVSESMSKGIIDGATFPYEAVMAFDLGDVVTHSIEPGIASAVFMVAMNEAKFNALSPEHQKLIEETTGAPRGKAFGALYDAGEAKGTEYVASKGVKIIKLEGDELAKLTSLGQPIIDATIKAVGDTGKPAQAFYDAYTK